MPSMTPSFTLTLAGLLLVAYLAAPVAAFGAGNIASIARIEGQNWRHGDIEDTLLNLIMSRAAGGKKFGKLDVKRVYFGNWLRDYSQAVDVGTVKYVSAEAIRIILWVLGFMSFGYGTKEFEVTTDRLGCYRPEEHIDNPKDYADNEDARQYDRRLRGPVDERRELAVNPQTGLKNYIATENIGIATSAGLVRNLFGRSIHLGRQYARSNNKADLYEALRLLGTGCHCLEDFSAHSNYTELALIELGERDVFPHVGRRTMMNLPGARQPVYPIITGTFGGVDFLHSVMGEFSDKATQSEIQELEGTMTNSGQNNSSVLQDLLNQLPSGLFGDKDQAATANELQANATAAQMQQTQISPRQPEAWTRQLQDVQKQLYPILEWHDEMMQSITEAIEKIPVLPQLIENLQEQLNIFVFSLMAPFVLPIINQVKTELNTGSSEIIQSSKDKQLIVFHDDNSTDPTHSMLSKDHFSNVLNEPAGKVASQVLKWVVPQLISCWDDERIDVDRTLNRVITGVFHHPALRYYGDDGAADGRRLMFGIVEQWWGQKDEEERQILRNQLSREGVEQGRNHKPGVVDSGHGCCKPLGMPTMKTAQSSGAVGGLAGGTVFNEIGSALAGESKYDAGYTGGGGGIATSGSSSGGVGKIVSEAAGGGAIGGLVGGIAGAVGGDLLGDAFGGSNAKKQTYQKSQYEADGSYTQNVTQTGYTEPGYGGGQQRYGQAEYSQTSFVEGGGRAQYQRYEQDDRYGRTGYGQSVIQESRPTYGGGYEQTTETRYERPGGEWQSEVRVEGRETGSSGYYQETKRFSGQGYKKDSDSDSDDEYKKEKKKKHHKKHDSDSDDDKPRERLTETEFEDTQGGYDGSRYGGQSYGQESSYQQPRPAYETGGYGGSGEYESRQRESYGGRGGYGGTSDSRGRSSYGGGPEYETDDRTEERPSYGSGGGGFFGGEGRGREEGYNQEEPTEGYGEGRGYSRGDDEYQERRGYGEGEGHSGDEYQERRGYGEGDGDGGYVGED
ncbi:MAG: hypothetical protein Q9217_005016 [Psora testacea]